MTRRTDPAALLAICIMLVCALALPFYQWVNFGFIFYANALDESNYLQYHLSLLAAKLMVRPVQNLVTLLHELGFSAGKIHLLFDLAIPLGFLVLTANILSKLKLLSGSPWLNALSLIALPLLFNTFNPAVAWLRDFALESQLLYWVTLPDASFPPLLRTPEPQTSWFLVAASAALALRVKHCWPLLLPIPLLYTFIGVPLAFIAGTLVLMSLPLLRKTSPMVVAMLSYVGLSLLLRIYLIYFVRAEAKGNILLSSIPLVSYCGVLTLSFYFLLRKRFSERTRKVALVLALSPWVVSNTQILSGFITAPGNFEQYFSVMVVSLLFLMAVDHYTATRRARYAFVALLYLAFSLRVWLTHRDYLRMLPPTPELLAALQHDASKVVINHPVIAVLYNQIYPMQDPTFLSYSKVYWGQAREMLPEYLCVKRRIHEDPALREAYRNILARFDAALKNETEDDPWISLYRREFPSPRLDVARVPDKCPDISYRFFTITTDD